jgi:DNA-binding response OmpR family regulator
LAVSALRVIAWLPMARGVVLVIEDDEWVARLLANAIRGADYEVVVCATAKSGVETAVTSQPDCIICDVDLPDNDGYWVARNVRTQSSRVSVTPFLFLSGLDDQESRLEGFHVGADVYMTKPFRVDEVVAQVGALVAMAARLRQRRESLISVQPTPNSARCRSRPCSRSSRWSAAAARSRSSARSGAPRSTSPPATS